MKKINEIINNFKAVGLALAEDHINFLTDRQKDIYDKSIEHHLKMSRELRKKLGKASKVCKVKKEASNKYANMQKDLDSGLSPYAVARKHSESESMLSYYFKQGYLTKKGKKNEKTIS